MFLASLFYAKDIHIHSPVEKGDPSCNINLCVNWQQKQVKLLDKDQVDNNLSAPLNMSGVWTVGLVNFVCWAPKPSF